MDNLEQGSGPVGVEDVTSSQGQPETTETQPDSENTQTVDDGSVPQEEGSVSFPWQSDPKFKDATPEDIYKAYQEEQKVLGQVSQKAQLSNFIEQKYGLTPEKFMQMAQEEEANKQAQAYQDNPLAPLIQETRQIKSELAYMKEEKALDEFLTKNPDYSPFRDKLMKIGFTAEQGKSYADIAKEYFGDAIATGQKKAYEKIETKTKSQASGSMSQPKKSFTVEDLKKMSSEEMEAILPWADISQRL